MFTNKNNFILIFFLILTSFISINFSTIMPEPQHDGMVLKPAIDITEGKIIFKETVSHFGLLFNLMNASVLKIFGKKLKILRNFYALIYIMIACLLYLIWSKYLTNSLTILSCLIWLFLSPYLIDFMMPWSSIPALFFLLISIIFFNRNKERKKKIYLISCGITVSLTFWTRQPVGVFLYCTYFAIFFLEYLFSIISLKELIKKNLIFFFGFFACSLIFILYMILNGALYDWYLQNFKFAAIIGKLYGNQDSLLKRIGCSLLPGIFTKSHWLVSKLWALLPLISITFLLILILKNNKYKDNFINNQNKINFIIISLGSYLQYFPLADIHHVFWAATPMIGICSMFFLYIFNKIKYRKLFTYCSIIVFFLLTGDLSIYYKYMIHRINGPGRPKISETSEMFSNEKYVTINDIKILNGMKVRKEVYFFYKKINEVIIKKKKLYPDISIITPGPDALFLTFIENNENFHPLHSIPPFWNKYWSKFGSYYENYNLQLRKFIHSKRPLIITDFKDFIKNGELYKDYSIELKLESPIASNCLPVGYLNPLVIIANNSINY